MKKVLLLAALMIVSPLGIAKDSLVMTCYFSVENNLNQIHGEFPSDCMKQSYIDEYLKANEIFKPVLLIDVVQATKPPEFPVGYKEHPVRTGGIIGYF